MIQNTHSHNVYYLWESIDKPVQKNSTQFLPFIELRLNSFYMTIINVCYYNYLLTNSLPLFAFFSFSVSFFSCTLCISPLSIDHIVLGHQKTIWTALYQREHQPQPFYRTKINSNSTNAYMLQPANQCIPIGWSTKSRHICCSMRTIRSIGIHGAMRRLQRQRPKIKWFSCPWATQHVIGAMSWRRSHLRVPKWRPLWTGTL